MPCKTPSVQLPIVQTTFAIWDEVVFSGTKLLLKCSVAPASTTFEVTEAQKLSHHDKVVVHRESNGSGVSHSTK